ncbi:MAG: DUF1350 family protein [Pseudanabaenaceae cyanobacterium bins.68]|nr:DUF1350 family protein [Pseudanabaenaceae cyanobacterium bins.68]
MVSSSISWREVEQSWVLTPPQPKAVVHFLGGAFFAAAPQLSYRHLLEAIASHGYVIVATPFLNSSFDHRQIATEVHQSFRRLRSKLFLDFFPVFGMGHSMGCKLQLLINSYFSPQRQGNILIAHNNYSADRSIPLFKQLALTIPELQAIEFDPSPRVTNLLVDQSYRVSQNLLIKFDQDEIDQILPLSRQLQAKFGAGVDLRILPGNHLTCAGLDPNWQAGAQFSALDAIAQWMKQEVYRDITRLEQTIIDWLALQVEAKQV